MCVVYMGDIGGGMLWPPSHPYNPGPFAPWAPVPGSIPIDPIPGPITTDTTESSSTVVTLLAFPTRAQFEAFDTLLRAAMKFDEATGQKECETAAKTAWIKSFYIHFGMPCPL
jgi:hypothetical protein